MVGVSPIGSGAPGRKSRGVPWGGPGERLGCPYPRGVPRSVALSVLRSVDRGRGLAREGLDAAVASAGLSARDRGLAHELVIGTLRRLGTLDHLLAPFLRKEIAAAHGADRAALRMGAYQLVFLDRVPAHAAVHATVGAVRGAGRPPGFVNAVLRRLADRVAGVVDGVMHGSGDDARDGTADGVVRAAGRDPRRLVPHGDGRATELTEAVLPDPAAGLNAYLAAAWAHPLWMVERFASQLPLPQLVETLRAGVVRPPLSVRPATAHRDSLRSELEAAGVVVVPEGPCFLLSTGVGVGAGSVSALPGFADGRFSVQDAAAAEAVDVAAPQPGEVVLDLCAAPGGKTVALAEAVGPEGVVLAVDLPGPRLERLRMHAQRRRLGNVHVLGADVTDPEALPRGTAEGRPFDLVVVDAPCSNTGVLARRVEARRRLGGEDRLLMLAEQAAHMVLVGLDRLGPGGRLVYSTCSIDAAENEDVVEAVLDEDPRLVLARERTFLPVPGRRGGGYVAVLSRMDA